MFLGIGAGMGFHSLEDIDIGTYVFIGGRGNSRIFDDLGVLSLLLVG
jgi:hypothetical protein